MLFLDTTLSHAQQASAMAAHLPTTFVAALFALITVIVAALVAVLWCVSLYVEVVGELSTQMTTRSTQADPMVKRVMLVLITYGVVTLLYLGRR